VKKPAAGHRCEIHVGQSLFWAERQQQFRAPASPAHLIATNAKVARVGLETTRDGL
jgi:hypothetical protein